LRIQTSDTLATPDAERVLRVLEWSLREVSVEVVREGRWITMRGLGPSQRTMNRNDIAVVEVASENDHTVIRADITFLASALMGGVPQDDLVRSKLDRVLDRVKMELGTKSVRGEASPWASDSAYEAVDGEARHIFAEAALVAAHSVEPAPYGVAEHIVAAESVREPEPEAVAEAEPAVALQGVSEVSSERVVTPPVELPVVRVTRVATQELKSTGAVAASSPVAVSSPSGHRRAIPIFQSFHPEEAKTPRRWGLLATVVCMLAAVALFLAWPYLVGLVHERLAPASSGSDQSTAAEAAKLSDDKTPMQAPDANAAAVGDAAIHTESDPRVWLESWADAMRGQDAGAQASFYADAVEHYALKSNVSNADVWLDKQNAIQSRPKSWTVRLENVVVEPRPDESIRVRLTKHYTSQSDEGRVSERFVHSQLKLRKIDGQWKITSEQNLRP
jgi:ketosteroid isomerase-like protein